MSQGNHFSFATRQMHVLFFSGMTVEPSQTYKTAYIYISVCVYVCVYLHTWKTWQRIYVIHPSPFNLKNSSKLL